MLPASQAHFDKLEPLYQRADTVRHVDNRHQPGIHSNTAKFKYICLTRLISLRIEIDGEVGKLTCCRRWMHRWSAAETGWHGGFRLQRASRQGHTLRCLDWLQWLAWCCILPDLCSLPCYCILSCKCIMLHKRALSHGTILARCCGLFDGCILSHG